MNGALVIASAIFFHASWTTPSEKTEDQMFAMVLALAAFGVAVFRWLAP